MRTTVELPEELMKHAKAEAAARGESLKSLLTKAVASELGRSHRQRGKLGRVKLPLFGDPKGKPIKITGEDIARALVEDDEIMARRAMRQRAK